MKRNARPKITALILTLNEQESLPYALSRIPPWVHEVLLVDGHSQDATVELARRLRPDIRVSYQPGSGKGDALRFGVQQARGDIVVTLDADGETDPADIPRFLEPLLEGYDLAKGSRFLQGRPPNMPWHRWLGNKILALTCNLLHGTRYTDICSGYNAFWKEAFLRLPLSRDGFEMEQEMLVQARRVGLRVAEVYHHDGGRIAGASKVSDLRQGFKDWLIIVGERLRA